MWTRSRNAQAAAHDQESPITRRLRPLAAIVAIVVLGAHCSRATPKLASGSQRGRNVLLITIDTLRRDRVGAYGNRNNLTPSIDRLAAEGLRYTNARAHVPMTLPSHTSILTGLLPPHHGVRNNVSFRLGDRIPTIATMLKAAGYRTGAFVGAFVLDARFGLNRGFDDYDDRGLHETEATSFNFAQRRAADVLDSAAAWILGSSSDQRSAIGNSPSSIPHQPFFAWVHLFDPHTPYDAPPEYRAGRAPYDAEVAYTDAMLGRFLDRLRSAGLLDQTLVVLTADHGESLGEHGESTHGLFAYDATLAVPLVIRAPGGPSGTVDVPAGHDDVLPTIADLVGAAAPPAVDGRSLAAEGPASDRAIYFEALDASLTRGWAPLTGVVASGRKYIDLPVQELYDLARDPSELVNTAAEDSGHRAELARALTSIESASSKAVTAALDADAAARLRALGYVGGSAPMRTAPYTSADDPKQLVSLNEAFDAALEAFNAGRRDEALAQFVAVLRARPDFLTARTSAATVLMATGRAGEAAALLRAAPASQSGAPELLSKLGGALRDAGDLPGAINAFEAALAAGGRNPDLYNDLGVVYARAGRAADARRMFNEMLALDPGAAGTWYNLGVLELTTKRPDAAAAALRHAVDENPRYGDAWQALGAALLPHDRDAAVKAWRTAERLLPDDFDLLYNLAMVLADGPEPDEALPYLDRFAREAPRDRYGRDLPVVNARIAKLRR